MSIYHPKIAAIVRRDGRYAYEAYEFVFAALAHTQKLLGRVPRGEAGEEADERRPTAATPPGGERGCHGGSLRGGHPNHRGGKRGQPDGGPDWEDTIQARGHLGLGEGVESTQGAPGRQA